jgi:hypothetical protein
VSPKAKYFDLFTPRHNLSYFSFVNELSKAETILLR